ncbi:MAG: DNA polymerase III subunit beta [Deltaproteobacteria bacterium]|jgi:DNA polymerase-3 subunit beta|nr:DNA polymerase III subunit beta [Deltaproteobacteria bacterium]
MLEASVRRDDLKEALAFAGGAVLSNTSMPLLGDVAIAAEDGALTFAATDLELHLSVRIPAGAAGRGGALAVPAGALGDFAKSAPDPDVRLTETGGRRLTAESGPFRAEIICDGTEDFPPAPAEAPRTAGTLPGGALADALDKTRHTASPSVRNFNLSGVCLQSAGGELELVSSDADILCKATAPGGDFALDCPALISRKAAEQLRAFAADAGGGPLAMERTESFLTARAGGKTFNARLLGGAFPDWRALMPEGEREDLAVRRETFVRDLGNVGNFVSPQYRVVFLDFGDGTVRLSAEDSRKGSASTSQPTAGDVAGPRSFGLDPANLLKVLKTLRGDTAVFRWHGPKSPVVLTSDGDPGFLALISTVTPKEGGAS